MAKYPFIKKSFVIFLFLAIIISLFPPFEFGGGDRDRNPHVYRLGITPPDEWDESTEYVRLKRTEYVSLTLPIKKYDFILSNNIKGIAIGYAGYSKKFYNEVELGYCKMLYKDAEFKFSLSSKDTIFKLQAILVKKAPEIRIRAIYSALVNGKIIGEYKTKVEAEQNIRLKEMEIIDKGGDIPLFTDVIKKTSSGLRTLPAYILQEMYYHGIPIPTPQQTENYNEVKNEYEKKPNDWWVKVIGKKIESIKKYDEYSIRQEVYAMLHRNILFGELIVEYFLAFFLSIILGYGIQVNRFKNTSLLNILKKVTLRR